MILTLCLGSLKEADLGWVGFALHTRSSRSFGCPWVLLESRSSAKAVVVMGCVSCSRVPPALNKPPMYIFFRSGGLEEFSKWEIHQKNQTQWSKTFESFQNYFWIWTECNSESKQKEERTGQAPHQMPRELLRGWSFAADQEGKHLGLRLLYTLQSSQIWHQLYWTLLLGRLRMVHRAHK